MSYMHSFTDVEPPVRYDAVAWASVHIEESSDNATWTEVDVQALAADPNPATPTPVNISVTSSLETGFFRFRFEDAGGTLSPYTGSVPSPGLAEASDLLPSIADVALRLRTRTVGTTQVTGGLGADTGPAEVTTFDDTTRPTATEVQRVIETAYDVLIGRIIVAPELIPAQVRGTFRQAVAAYASLLVEWSFFRETYDDALALREQAQIDTAIVSVNAGVEVDQGTRVPTFGVVKLTTDRTPPSMVSPYDLIQGIDF